MLQDENPLLSSPGPSSTSPQQFDNAFANVQIKPDYSMMDTSNEGYNSSPQSQIQYATTSANSMEYHQMVPQSIQFNHFSQFEQQQYPPHQFGYDLPRASSSSAIHGMLGANELQQVIVDETTLIRPLVSQ